jgi:hypothetical protein
VLVLNDPAARRHRFDTPGEFHYRSLIYCFMKGSVTVVPSSGAMGGGEDREGAGEGVRGARGVGMQTVASRQGLTLVHYSAQCKHILWDTVGA